MCGYRFSLSILGLLILISVPAFAKVHEYKLDNGLKVLVKEDHRSPVVVSQVWYRVGGSYEHDGITGISHALEHMMFKGTEKFPAGVFSRIIAENGGQDNAFTGPDYTTYFQTLEKSRLAISFELEADRMQFLTLPEDEFAKEIEVVKEERRWRTEDNPQAYLYEVTKATAYQTSPYRLPIVGWMEDLNMMTVAELKSWYKKWYAPNNATLVVVGDVDPKEVYVLAKKHFGDIPASETIQAKTLTEVEQQGLKQVTVKRPAELPYLIMAYKTPSLKSASIDDTVEDWEPYALEVLASILDGAKSARFDSRLIRGSEVAAEASAGYRIVSRLDNLFMLSGTPAQGKTIADLEAAFRQELRDIQTNLVTDAELQRVKTQVISANIYEKDSIFYQALVMGMLETIGLGWQVADDYVERINAITADQLMSVANKYMIDDGLTLAELDPLPLNEKSRPQITSPAHPE